MLGWFLLLTFPHPVTVELVGVTGILLAQGAAGRVPIPTHTLPQPQQLDGTGYISKKFEKRVDKCIKYIMVAGKKALEDAKLPADSPQLKVGCWETP